LIGEPCSSRSIRFGCRTCKAQDNKLF
jgi:hypothetical protein